MLCENQILVIQFQLSLYAGSDVSAAWTWFPFDWGEKEPQKDKTLGLGGLEK